MAKKVLIVDDNQELCSILKCRLEHGGFAVETLKDGYALLGYLRGESAPDVLVLDLMMPGKSGIDLLYGVKSKWPDVKIFIFSGFSEYKEKEELKEYISGFFCKPDDSSRLIETIQREL